MSTTLDLSKSVHDLAEEHEKFVPIMIDLGFTSIAKPAALNTVGRVMTVPKGCDIKDIPLKDAVAAFEAAGFTVIGVGAESDSRAQDSAKSPAAEPAPSTAAENETPAATDEAGRAALLKSYVARLSAGEALEDVRRDFVANFSDVDAAEIARAEQSLIAEGTNIGDVQRLCDVHSALFHGATREEKIANAEQAVMSSLSTIDVDAGTRALAGVPGHPVQVFTRENEAISAQIERARSALVTSAAPDALRALSALGIHYAKKGDLIYPILKLNHDFSGPSEVMWGVDDEIRAEIRSLLSASAQDDAWRTRAEAVLTRAEEMVYKETNILLPLCAQCFTSDEWLQMYADMKGYDTCLIDDAGTWEEGEAYARQRAADAEANRGVATAGDAGTIAGGEVRLPSGRLTADQLDALLNALPLELTFVDADDVNRYWNDNGEKRLFKRPSAALGREVRHCHPPMVEQMMSQVIASLKSGEQDSVDVWMEKGGEPVLVRYLAIRDRNGAYQGTMEAVQRMGFAQKHFTGDAE